MVKRMKENPLSILVLIGSIFLILTGFIAGGNYLYSFYYLQLAIVDDLLSGIVTLFFISSIGFTMLFFLYPLVRNRNLKSLKSYGLIGLGVYILVGIIFSLCAAIIYDLSFLIASFIFLLYLGGIVFLLYLSSNKSGFILFKKTAKYLATAVNKEFYIDGVNIYESKNFQVINKNISIYNNFPKKVKIAESEKIYLIKGQTREFYLVKLSLNSDVDLICLANFKSSFILSFIKNNDDLMKNQNNYEEYVLSTLDSSFQLKNHLIYRILSRDDLFKIELYHILLMPKMNKTTGLQFIYFLDDSDYVFSSKEEALKCIEN